MDERFLEAVVHKRPPLLARLRGYSGHVVLGRRLRPYSNWHQQLLASIDSPFLSVWKKTPGSLQIFESLYLATELCRLKPLEAPKRHKNRLAVLRRKWTVFRFYFRFRFKPPGVCQVKMLLEAASFRAYIADYSSGPIPFPTRHSKPVQTPVMLFQLELYRRFHPEKSHLVWAMSPGETAWANTAAQEANDREISIMTEARIKARDEAIRKGKERSAKRKKDSHLSPNDSQPSAQ